MAEMFEKRKAQEDQNKKKEKDRGAKDDWEALKLVLDEHPALKQRVIHKLKSLIEEGKEEPLKISKKEQRDLKLQNQKKEKEGKK
jgi:hypothetical protein